MKKRIGLIGVGHMGQFLITGLAKADRNLEFLLADAFSKTAEAFAAEHDCFFSTRNQEVVEKSDIILLATRPEHVKSALADTTFKPEQVLVSVAAGVSLKILEPLAAPAGVVRAMPVSCVVVNKSPVIIYPDNSDVQALFSLVGHVHPLPDEASFAPGTALVGAFYAWLFLLMSEAATWTGEQGIDPDTARKLVVETIEGACAMAGYQDSMSLGEIWKTLATPGGISEQGAGILSKGGGLKTWSDALEAVSKRMKG